MVLYHPPMTAPFTYTETEIAAVLRVRPAAVKAWVRRGELRSIALTSDGRSLFALSDVEAIGRRLARLENVRVLRPNAASVPGRPPVRDQSAQPLQT
jgi:hypothetical protein